MCKQEYGEVVKDPSQGVRKLLVQGHECAGHGQGQEIERD